MSETALLDAVRRRIVTECGYSENQCEVELDPNTVPALVGDLYVLVHPSGWSAGPNNETSGGVLDELYSIGVTVIKRCTAIPRDRRRSVLLDNLKGLNVHVRRIIAAVQFNYAINNLANENVGNHEGFVEALKFRAVTEPREVDAAVFAAQAGAQPVGIGRTIIFGGARRIQTIASTLT